MKNVLLFLIVLFPLISMADSTSDKELIRRKIRNNLSTFAKCHTDALKTNPNLEGKTVLSWEYDDKGTVKKAKVMKTSIQDKSFESCLLDKLKSIKFPPAPTGKSVNITYPFSFSPNK